MLISDYSGRMFRSHCSRTVCPGHTTAGEEAQVKPQCEDAQVTLQKVSELRSNYTVLGVQSGGGGGWGCVHACKCVCMCVCVWGGGARVCVCMHA